MNYLSVCSGVEAATVAWHHMGWKPVGFSEIEQFPSAVLNHHYPSVTNFGDMTNFKEWSLNEPVDLLVGGTPCQSFSIAGLRKGLSDERGNLALVYCQMLDHYKPKWCVWENVPGVLSSSGGRDFSSFLGALAELGYGFAYRVLDAQFFGVAQRRKRVFVVGHFGDWRPPSEVLFERQSSAGILTQINREQQAIARGIQAVVFENHGTDSRVKRVDVCPTVTARWGTGGNNVPIVLQNGSLRNVTPIEAERLQGFPDNYTNIPWRNKPESPDAPRYKAMGNSMAVPVMQWIGKRIQSAVLKADNDNNQITQAKTA